MRYKRYSSIDRQRPTWIIVENGNVINYSPTKEELKVLNVELPRNELYKDKEYFKERLRKYYKTNIKVPMEVDFVDNHEYPSYSTYVRIFGNWKNALKESGLWERRHNPTHTCDRCGKSFNNLEWGHPRRECNKDGKPTGRLDCPSCYQKYDPNSRDNLIRSTLNCRNNDKNPCFNNTKGDDTQELACVLYGWEDLNKKYNNYKSSIDCIDKNGILHQIRGRSLSCDSKCWYYWDFSNLKIEWKKDYKDMVLFCLSRDRKIIEEIYKIPFEEEIKGKRKSITISKNRSRKSETLYWYEKYRIKDEEEYKNANGIWQKIQ